MITVTLDFDPPDVPTAVRTTAVATDGGAPVPGLSYPIAWAAGADGKWSFGFQEAAGVAGYTYTAVASYGAVDTPPFVGVVTVGASATGLVARVMQAARDRFSPNLAYWSARTAGVNSVAVENTSRVSQGAMYAIGRVRARYGYVVGNRASDGVVSALAVLSAWWNYTTSGFQDQDITGNHLKVLTEDEAWADLEALRYRADAAVQFDDQSGVSVAGPVARSFWPTVDGQGRPQTPSNQAAGVYYDPNAKRSRFNGFGVP